MDIATGFFTYSSLSHSGSAFTWFVNIDYAQACDTSVAPAPADFNTNLGAGPSTVTWFSPTRLRLFFSTPTVPTTLTYYNLANAIRDYTLVNHQSPFTNAPIP